MKYLAALLAILALVYFNADFFTLESISGQFLSAVSEPLSQEAAEALSQPYHYLGKGKQAYAFVSADGKWVVKFFNHKYFKLPFWAAVVPREKTKREKRKQFYLNSYQIASKMFKEETGLVYLHQGLSPYRLPQLAATDKMGISHRIDLNKISFVLQKKVEPFYPALQKMTQEDLSSAIGQFLSIIAFRIDHKIGDSDHEVENNFGVLEGKVVQLDPGRLHLEERLWEPEKLSHEWWSATHRFRKWLEKNYPDKITFFDNEIETNLQRVLQRSQASLPLQRDGLLQERSPAFSDI